jgi:hypothetical protein
VGDAGSARLLSQERTAWKPSLGTVKVTARAVPSEEPHPNYFGSADSRLIECDFTRDQQRDFTIRKEILWESETATRSELSLVEVDFIRRLRSHDPAIGYNRWPRYKPGSAPGSASV